MSRHHRHMGNLTLAAALACLTISCCSGTPTAPSAPSQTNHADAVSGPVEDFITAVDGPDGDGVLIRGESPITNSDIAMSVQAPHMASRNEMLGASVRIESGYGELESIIITVSGAEGFYQLTTPRKSVRLRLSGTIEVPAIELLCARVDTHRSRDTEIGPYEPHSIRLVGTKDPAAYPDVSGEWLITGASYYWDARHWCGLLEVPLSLRQTDGLFAGSVGAGYKKCTYGLADPADGAVLRAGSLSRDGRISFEILYPPRWKSDPTDSWVFTGLVGYTTISGTVRPLPPAHSVRGSFTIER